MRPLPDEVARQRASRAVHPLCRPPMVEEAAAVTVLHEGLVERAARGDLVARDRLAAAADRAAAALDRYEAALERHRAAADALRSCRDSLTGAWGRDVGLKHLAEELARASRDKVPLVVAFVDVDGLKRINDDRGHLAGDEALRQVGTALRRDLRGYDLVVRFGGDELVCSLSDTTLFDGAARFRTVQEGLSALRPACSISVGLVRPSPGERLVDTLGRADAALYAGRRAVQRSVPEPAEVTPRR